MATTLSLEDIKNIDRETKCIVTGFVKDVQKLLPLDNVYYTIPTLIIHWIILYYFQPDSFDPTNCGKCHILSQDNTIVTNGWNACVYLSKVIKSGVQEWKFKILKCKSEWNFMTIGVWKMNHPLEPQSVVWNDKVGNKSYAWIINYQKLIHNAYVGQWRNYGPRPCTTGDIIQMTLDLKEMQLRFALY